VVLCDDLTLSVAGIFQTYDFWLSQDCFSDPEGGPIQAFSTQGNFGSVTAPTNEYCASLAGNAWCWQYQPQSWDGTPYWDSFNIWVEDAAGNKSAPIRIDLCLNC
jgi:hypothetical protein